MVRRLSLGKNNHLTYISLALNPRYTNSRDPDQTEHPVEDIGLKRKILTQCIAAQTGLGIPNLYML